MRVRFNEILKIIATMKAKPYNDRTIESQKLVWNEVPFSQRKQTMLNITMTSSAMTPKKSSRTNKECSMILREAHFEL